MSNNNRILWFLIGLLGGLIICAITVFTLYLRFPAFKSTDTAQPSITSMPAPIDTTTLVNTTLTPTTAGITPIPPIITTQSPTGMFVQAQLATNCRQGPGTEYSVLGLLRADQQSIVLGKNSDQTWWYIENPEKTETACWVNGKTTELKGDAGLLTIITPPPPPLTGVSFLGAFSEVINCANNPLAIIQIENTGTERLESMSMLMVDQTISDNIFYIPATNFPFLDKKEPCTIGNEYLDVGKTGIVGGFLGEVSRRGHLIRTNIKMCSEDYLSGSCAELIVEFVAP